MSPEPIDPPSLLKRLFERRGRFKGTSPEALFQSPASAGEPVPGKAAPSFTSLKRVGQRLGQILRTFPTRLPARRAPRQGVIGLDIGTSALKWVRLEPEDGQMTLTQASLIEWPPGTDELARESLLKEHLKELKRAGQLSGPIVLNYHHSDSLVETIRLPKMPAGELEQAVLWEARERLSLKPERSVIRYIPVGEAMVEGQAQLEILVVSVPKEPLLNRWRLFAELGLKIVAVEPTNLVGFYPLLYLKLWKPTEVVGHLEMGFTMSHLSVVRGNTIRFNRCFPIGGDSITQSIADYCQVDYSKAEEQKRLYGISKMALEEDRHEAGHEEEDRVKVSHALGLHLEQLVAEIDHSWRYFAFELGETEAPRMDRLFITGGGGLLKYLPEFLTSRLTVPVEVVDPLRGFKIRSGVEDQLKAGFRQRLAVSLGLALRPMG